MTLNELNRLPHYRAEEELLKCCGSKAWARAMARRRPFANNGRLLQAASEIWNSLDEGDRKQACRNAGEQRMHADTEAQIKLTLSRLKLFFPL